MYKSGVMCGVVMHVCKNGGICGVVMHVCVMLVGFVGW